MKHAILALALVAALAAPAFAADNETEASAYKSANDKMMQDMMAEPTGDADKDFVAMMIPHHQGAIDMAEVEMRYGKDPEIRKLAADIVKAQQREIAQMKDWQMRHSGPDVATGK